MTASRALTGAVVTISVIALIADMIGALMMTKVRMMFAPIIAVMMPLGLPPGGDAWPDRRLARTGWSVQALYLWQLALVLAKIMATKRLKGQNNGQSN